MPRKSRKSEESEKQISIRKASQKYLTARYDLYDNLDLFGSYIYSLAKEKKLKGWNRPSKILMAFLYYSEDHLVGILLSKGIEVEERNRFSLLQQVIENELNPYQSSYDLQDLLDLEKGDWEGLSIIWKDPVEHLVKRMNVDFLEKMNLEIDDLKDRRFLAFAVKCYEKKFFLPPNTLREISPKYQIIDVEANQHGQVDDFYKTVFQIPKASDVGRLLRQRVPDYTDYLRDITDVSIVYPWLFALTRPQNLIPREPKKYSGAVLFTNAFARAIKGIRFNVSQITSIPQSENLIELQDELDILSEYECIFDASIYTRIRAYSDESLIVLKNVLGLPMFLSKKILLFYILHGKYPKNFSLKKIEKRYQSFRVLTQSEAAIFLRIYGYSSIFDVVSITADESEEAVFQLIEIGRMKDIDYLQAYLQSLGILLPYVTPTQRLSGFDAIYSYLTENFHSYLHLFTHVSKTNLSSQKDLDLVERYGIEPFFTHRQSLLDAFNRETPQFWRLHDVTKAQSARTVGFVEIEDLTPEDRVVCYGTKDHFYWMLTSEILLRFTSGATNVIPAPYRHYENATWSLEDLARIGQNLGDPELVALYHTRTADRNSDLLLAGISLENQETFRRFFEFLFITGMYMRRWRGPGFPYPMKRDETTVQNGFLAIVTLRMQEISDQIRGFNTEEREIYEHFKFVTRSTESRYGLKWLINQILAGHYCIRMASREIVETCIRQFASIGLTFNDPVTQAVINVENMDPII